MCFVSSPGPPRREEEPRPAVRREGEARPPPRASSASLVQWFLTVQQFSIIIVKCLGPLDQRGPGIGRPTESWSAAGRRRGWGWTLRDAPEGVRGREAKGQYLWYPWGYGVLRGGEKIVVACIVRIEGCNVFKAAGRVSLALWEALCYVWCITICSFYFFTHTFRLKGKLMLALTISAALQRFTTFPLVTYVINGGTSCMQVFLFLEYPFIRSSAKLKLWCFVLYFPCMFLLQAVKGLSRPSSERLQWVYNSFKTVALMVWSKTVGFTKPDGSPIKVGLSKYSWRNLSF